MKERLIGKKERLIGKINKKEGNQVLIRKSKRIDKRVCSILTVAFLIGVLVVLVNCGPSQAQSFKPEDYTVSLEEDWPTFYDPAVGTDFSDLIAVTNIHDALVFLNNDNTVKPWLAEKWERNDDGTIWKFYLRKGVKFHNGETLKASDVVFSVNRMKAIGEGLSFLFLKINEAKALDDYTVQFTLKEPFGPFLQTLIRLYVVSEKGIMAHIKKPGPYGEYGDYAKEWYLTHDVGSGPYKVKEVKIAEYVLMEKFDDWWGGWDPNAPKYFRMFAQPAPAVIHTLMANHKLEISDEWQANETYESLSKIPGVKIAKYVVGHNMTLGLNCAKSPTDDVHFRKAIAYSINYAALVDPKAGVAPGSLPSKGPVVQNLPKWNPDLTMYTYDLEKAKAELAQSKYADNPGAIPVTYYWAQEVPWTEKIALQIQFDAAKIGIKIELTMKPFGSMIADAQSKETSPNIFSVILAPYYPEAGSPIFTEMHSSTQGSYDNIHWLGNIMDKEIEDALATIDEKERSAKYAKLQQEIIDLCPTLWIFDQVEQRAVQTGYFYWPGVDLKEVACASGYPLYAHDMRIYPEKR